MHTAKLFTNGKSQAVRLPQEFKFSGAEVYIKRIGCNVLLIPKDNPIKVEPQEHNRFRFWGTIPEMDGKVFRVVTLEDKKTIHNAFPDRRFKP